MSFILNLVCLEHNEYWNVFHFFNIPFYLLYFFIINSNIKCQVFDFRSANTMEIEMGKANNTKNQSMKVSLKNCKRKQERKKEV